MSLELRLVDFMQIQHYFVDFQKKSKCYEMPPDHAEFLGAFKDNKLVGYLIICGYDNKYVEINQGYLLKEARHSNLGPQYLKLLEDICKKTGYKKIVFNASRSLGAYLEYAKQSGYKPERIIFSKEV